MALISIDAETNAMYVRVSTEKRKINETISLGEDRFMDVDELGQVIGFEVLLPKAIPSEAEEAIIRSREQIELIQ
jgi:uncharacterized protein YuzE